ncbi:MAG: hypothetical protein IKB82_00555 [Clostridia bacterium]|nr:hypothetical protein [Clostridia bacterium]
MRRILAACMILAALPALALAQITVTGEARQNGENRIFCFTAEAVPGETEISEEEQLALDMRLMMVNGAISMRLGQARAQQIYEMANAGGLPIDQTAHGYADENLASLAVIWRGMQPDGSEACRPYSLTIDLNTGLEIAFDQLFADTAGAVAAMEDIIQRDYLESMNAYIEAADLLPMPTNCFSFDETGLTIYYDDTRYRMFDGSSGQVTFYWHEIAPFIGEDSPVYALSRPQAADVQAIRSAEGYFGKHNLLGVHEPLGKAMQAYGLTDEPDYTATSILYPLEGSALRGMAVEIPKYAETAPELTPISAVRHSRASWHGLVTGATTREEIVLLLGEPDDVHVYSEDEAFDMMLEPGESLVYALGKGARPMVLQAHLDGDGVLSCIILRDAMPESLY